MNGSQFKFGGTNLPSPSGSYTPVFCMENWKMDGSNLKDRDNNNDDWEYTCLDVCLMLLFISTGMNNNIVKSVKLNNVQALHDLEGNGLLHGLNSKPSSTWLLILLMKDP